MLFNLLDTRLIKDSKPTLKIEKYTFISFYNQHSYFALNTYENITDKNNLQHIHQ